MSFSDHVKVYACQIPIALMFLLGVTIGGTHEPMWGLLVIPLAPLHAWSQVWIGRNYWEADDE